MAAVLLILVLQMKKQLGRHGGPRPCACPSTPAPASPAWFPLLWVHSLAVLRDGPLVLTLPFALALPEDSASSSFWGSLPPLSSFSPLFECHLLTETFLAIPKPSSPTRYSLTLRFSTWATYPHQLGHFQIADAWRPLVWMSLRHQDHKKLPGIQISTPTHPCGSGPYLPPHLFYVVLCFCREWSKDSACPVSCRVPNTSASARQNSSASTCLMNEWGDGSLGKGSLPSEKSWGQQEKFGSSVNPPPPVLPIKSHSSYRPSLGVRTVGGMAGLAAAALRYWVAQW